jgi:hypothetical protein
VSAIRWFSAALLITAGTSARADLAPPAQAPTSTSTLTPAPDRPPLLGLQAGLGVPDGLALSVTFRPWTEYLRLDAGLAWDTFGLGLRGGATFLPLHARLTPTFTFEAGTYFDANLRGALSHLNIPDLFKDASRSVGMSYVAGMVGLELGNPDGTLFFLRAGITRVWFTLPPSAGSNVVASEATADANLPAAVLGVIFHLW